MSIVNNQQHRKFETLLSIYSLSENAEILTGVGKPDDSTI
jgi:hypothetical protein